MEQTKKKNPLVSIIVITYNSVKYVLETLESAKAQTYEDIELIISDDGSIDDTVEICRDWINENKERFIGTELITVHGNTGIPANCNRGIKAAQGEWVKLIGGDDCLSINCIEKNIEYIQQYKLDLVFSQHYEFIQTQDQKIFKKKKPNTVKEFAFFDKTPSQQFKILLTHSFNIAPTSFFKRSIFDKVGFFNEKYHYIEDLPFWLKVTKAGISLRLMKETTVLYRIDNNSATRNNNHFYNISFYESISSMKREQVFPHVPFYNFFFWNNMAIEYLKFYILTRLFKNRKGSISNFVNAILNYLSVKYAFRSIMHKITKLIHK